MQKHYIRKVRHKLVLFVKSETTVQNPKNQQLSPANLWKIRNFWPEFKNVQTASRLYLADGEKSHRMKKTIVCALLAAMTMNTNLQAQSSAKPQDKKEKLPFIWQGANLYFLLVDRFNNGNKSNDVNFDRNQQTGKLRGFEGGDIKGITQKIEEGYFDKLGINAIWLTPIVEQVHGFVD